MNGIECATEARLVTDPEQRTSRAGKPFARFRAVVGADDQAQWVQVAAIGAKALDGVAALTKGDRAYIEGTIKLERWTAQDGTERSGLGLLAWKVVPLAQIGRRRPHKPKSSTLPPSARDWQQPLDADPPQADAEQAADDNIPF